MYVRFGKSKYREQPVSFRLQPVTPEQERSALWCVIGGCDEGLSYMMGRARTSVRSVTAQKGAIYLIAIDMGGSFVRQSAVFGGTRGIRTGLLTGCHWIDGTQIVTSSECRYR